MLTGGAGADTFIYSGGNDTITDYKAAQKDVIYISGTTLSKYHVEDTDVIFELANNNTLTIANGKNQTINFVDADGKAVSGLTKDNVYVDVTELVLTNKDEGIHDVSTNTDVIRIDGSKTTKAVNLIGNDTLTGGAGDDVFVINSGDGNDVIKDYNANAADEKDIIQLGKGVYVSKAAVVDVTDSNGDVTRQDYVFTLNKGKLTLEGAADKTVTFVDDYDNEIVYKQKTKSAGFVEEPNDIDYWFAADDNFAAAEDTFDSLITTTAVNTAINLTELNVDFTSINPGVRSQTTLAAHNN